MNELDTYNNVISNTTGTSDAFYLVQATDTDLTAQVCNVAEEGWLQRGIAKNNTIQILSVTVKDSDGELLKCQAADFQFEVLLRN